MKARPLSILLTVALALTNIMWIFLLLDRSITIDYMNQEATSARRTDSVLIRLIESKVSLKTKGSSIQDLRGLFSEKTITIEGDTIFVGDVGLRFKDDRFEKILLMNE
jgi:hypothetical protein